MVLDSSGDKTNTVISNQKGNDLEVYLPWHFICHRPKIVRCITKTITGYNNVHGHRITENNIIKNTYVDWTNE